MRVIFIIGKFIFLMLLFFTSLTTAQTQKQKKDEAVSQIAWNVTSHDFGEISQNIPVEFEFTFINNGNKPILISNAKASCSCTKVAYTPNPVLPALKGKLTVTYLAHTAGKFSKTVTVILSNKEKLVLRISGEVVQKK